MSNSSVTNNSATVSTDVFFGFRISYWIRNYGRHGSSLNALKRIG